MIFGSDVYPLRLFPTDAWFLFENLFPGGILVNKLDVWGGLIAGILVAGLAVFFQRTKTGRALRAVADDHAAAQSVGIPISWIWFVVWLVAGLVALVAATVWGTKLGVQFSITFLALKALPVLIIGGFTSIPGAIVGGLIVGAGEKLAEGFLGPHRSAAASNTGSPMCWRLPCCWCGRRACSANGSLSGFDRCFIARLASSRRVTPPTWRSSRSARTG